MFQWTNTSSLATWKRPGWMEITPGEKDVSMALGNKSVRVSRTLSKFQRLIDYQWHELLKGKKYSVHESCLKTRVGAHARLLLKKYIGGSGITPVGIKRQIFHLTFNLFIVIVVYEHFSFSFLTICKLTVSPDPLIKDLINQKSNTRDSGPGKLSVVRGTLQNYNHVLFLHGGPKMCSFVKKIYINVGSA